MIYPKSFPSFEGNDPPEKLMYDVLGKLPPDEFDIFYSVRFSGKGPDEKNDYEIDFIVADLRNERLNAIICIEDKRGHIEFTSDGRWTQNEREMKNAPTKQVMSSMYSLIKRFPEFSSSVPFGWMVSFPDGSGLLPGNFPTELNEQQLIHRLVLPDIKKMLTRYSRFIRESQKSRTGINIAEYERLFKSRILKEGKFVLSLSDRMAVDEKVFIELTADQRELLRLVECNQNVLVSGVAGSGKTILAKEVALEAFQSGKKVLFLCFNKVLAEHVGDDFRRTKDVNSTWFLHDPDLVERIIKGEMEVLDELKEINHDYPDGAGKKDTEAMITVANYHSFASSFISSVDPGWWIEQFGKRDFWTVEVPFKIQEIKEAEGINKDYDLVIIDEGQDFMELWYETVDYFLKEEGSFYVFMDQDQDIFNSFMRIPGKRNFVKYPLNENCRSTENIARKLSEIIKHEIRSKRGIPEGSPVRVINYRDPVEQQGAVLNEINSLLNDNSLKKNVIKTSDILILLNTESKQNSCLSNTQHVGEYPLRKLGSNGFFMRDAIHYTHINKFKGLEAKIVFIIDFDPASYDEKVFYTQASRARHLLYIFSKSEV